ncbi:MAG: FeoB small GTPase domain-containing protein [Vicinamibacteria bacterium]
MSPFFILVGPPGVGKSTLFQAFTGNYVAAFDYPGTAVPLVEGTVWMESRWVRVVDTPGVSSFLCPGEAERVTRDLLLAIPGAVAIVVADALDLERALALVIELSELGVPLALCLNKADGSAAGGLATDEAVLARRLGVPVVPTVATLGQAIRELRAALAHAEVPVLQADYGARVESAVTSVMRALANCRRARGLSLMLLAGDGTARPWIEARAGAGALIHVADLVEALTREIGFLPAVIADARRLAAARLAGSAQAPTALRKRLERSAVAASRFVTRAMATLVGGSRRRT